MKGKKSNVSDYRPVSLTVNLCKVLLIYNDRLKELDLQRLDGWRMRSDLLGTFKIVNRKYDINPELFFQLDEGIHASFVA